MRTHIIRREDLTDYAVNDLGLWASLTKDEPDAEEVEVEVVRITHYRAKPKQAEGK